MKDNHKNELNHEQNSLYSTSDMSLAAVLSLQFPIITVDRSNPRKALFFFSDTQQLQKITKKFWDNTLSVEPKAYFQSIKLLKSRIYSDLI